MAILDIKPASDCKYDMIALGEIMLRLDPGEGRVRTAREFKVWEGGGEYNVARGLRRCFGLRTAICTAFADSDVGRLIEDFNFAGRCRYCVCYAWPPHRPNPTGQNSPRTFSAESPMSPDPAAFPLTAPGQFIMTSF